MRTGACVLPARRHLHDERCVGQSGQRRHAGLISTIASIHRNGLEHTAHAQDKLAQQEARAAATCPLHKFPQKDLPPSRMAYTMRASIGV